MKKLLSVLLVLCMLSSFITFTVSAEKVNFIPEGSATFEEGEHAWSVLAGGAVKVTSNPTGEGKVLAYSGNPGKTYASPQIDVRPYIIENVSEETTVYASFDIYSKNKDISDIIIRIRTKTSEGFSKCAELGEAFCVLGKLAAFAGEWTRVSFSFDVTSEDLISEEPWNICLDGLSRHTLETIYIDNFYIGLDEECPYEENEDNGEAEVEIKDGENFLSEGNSTFEDGENNWTTIVGKGSVSVVGNPLGEGNVLCFSDFDPSITYASPSLDIRGAILKKVDEEMTIYGSMDIYCEKEFSGLVRIRTTTPEGFSLCEEGGEAYCAIGSANVVAGEWTKVTFSFELFESDLTSAEPWNLCFDGLFAKGTLAEGDCFYIDNVYVGITPGDEIGVENQPIPEKAEVTRFDETVVGTIRWDAFTKSTPDGTDPASQVARVLSPKKYHGQAPFFSVLNEDDTIAFPEYTVETWEKEAEYAVAGGLDYFAYLWYETTDNMSQPRKLHLQSEKKDIIKYCGILERVRSDKSMSELYEAMKDSCYLRVNGMPVLFLYEIKSSNWDKKAIEKIRQGAANAGIKEALYIIGMVVTEDLTVFSSCIAKGIDGISWYGVSALSTGEAYAVLAERNEKAMTQMGGFALANNVDIIPSFTTGRDTRARIETGVSWVDGDPNAADDKDKPYHNWYTLEPTMEELETHIANVIKYTHTAPNAKTNMVLSYGWNEHEEGGWLCPTLAVDKDGNPIYNEDGTIKANTERLDALKRAKESVLNAPLTTEAPAEATPTAVVGDDSGNVSFNPLFAVIPAVIVAIGVAVAIIVVKKKKQ